MNNLGHNPVVIEIPDTDTMTGLQCFDAADHMDKAVNPEQVDTLYATGASKLVTQFDADPDALQRMLVMDLNSRYPVADCPDKSDNQKRFKKCKQALQRAGEKAFPVENEETGRTYDGMVKIGFNVSGSKKKDSNDIRKRTVTVEIVTAVQVQVLADQADETAALAKEQKDAKKALAEKQEAQSRGTASAADQLKVMQQYMAETFGLGKEREVISLWLSDLNADNGDDIGDADTVDLSPLESIAS
jgi:hypothetical protein